MYSGYEKIKKCLCFISLVCFFVFSVFPESIILAAVFKRISILTPQINVIYQQGQNLKIKVVGANHVKIGLAKKEAADKQNIEQNIVGWIEELENADYIKEVVWNLWKTCDADFKNCQMVPAGDYRIVAVTKDKKPISADKLVFTDDNFDLSSGVISIMKGEMESKLLLFPNFLPQFGSFLDDSGLIEINVGEELTFNYQLDQNGVVASETVWNWDPAFLQKISDEPFKVKVLKDGDSTVSLRMFSVMVDDSTRIINSNAITVRGLKAGTAKVYVLNESLKNGVLDFDYIFSGNAANVCAILDEQFPASEYKVLPDPTNKRRIFCSKEKKSEITFSGLADNRTYYLTVLPFMDGKAIGSGIFAKQLVSIGSLAGLKENYEAWETAIVAGYKENTDVAEKICLILESEKSDDFYLTPPQEREGRKVVCSNHSEYEYPFTNLQPNTKYYLSFYGYNKVNNNWVLSGAKPISGKFEIETLVKKLNGPQMFIESDVVTYKGQNSDFSPNTNIDDLAVKMNIQMLGTNPSEDYRFITVAETISDSGKNKVLTYAIDGDYSKILRFVAKTEALANGTYEKLRLKNIKIYFVAAADIQGADTVCGKKIEEWGMNTASCAKGSALIDGEKLFAEHGYDMDSAYKGLHSTQILTLDLQDGISGQINDYYKVTDFGFNGSDLIFLSDDAKYRPKDNPYLEFDYKMTMDSNLSLGMQTADGRLYFFVGNKAQSPRIYPNAVVNYKQDNEWHRAKLNIYELIGKKDLEIKNIWIEDFDSGSKKFSYYFANFPSFVANFNPVLKQGDQVITYVPALKTEDALPMDFYYEVSDAGFLQRDLIKISDDAQYNLKDNPILEFDYKIPANVKISLGMLTAKGEIFFIAGNPQQSPRVTPRGVMNLAQDNSWHRIKINLYDILGKKSWEIKRIWFEDFETNEKYTYYFANFPSFIKNFDPQSGQGDQTVTKKIWTPPLTPNILENHAASPQVYLNFSGTSAKAKMLPAGGQQVEIKLAQFNAKAVSENFVIKKLPIKLSGQNYGRDFSFLTLKYPTNPLFPFVLDGTQVKAIPSSGNVVVFDNLNFEVAHQNENGVHFEVYGSSLSDEDSRETANSMAKINAGIYPTNDRAYFEVSGNKNQEALLIFRKLNLRAPLKDLRLTM